MDNPLVQPIFPIPFSQIQPEHIQPALDVLIAQAEQRIQAIAAITEPTYQNTLLASDTLTIELEYFGTVVGHLHSVVSTPELRAAYNQIIPQISAFFTNLTLRPELYQAIKTFAQTPEANELSPIRARLLQLTLDNFRRNGADLDAESKSKIEQIAGRLAEITTQYSNNVLDATNAFELYLHTPEQLAGLPESAIQAAQAAAQAKGQSGYRFSLQAPSYLAIQTYLDDAEVRKQLYLAFMQRATQGEQDNRPIIAEILKLRQAQAELLGYRNFADLTLENRMAKTGEQAMAFENQLHEQVWPHYQREYAELEAFAGKTLNPWDLAYYTEKLRQQQYDFDDEILRPYFSMPSVLSGMFQIAQQVFGIRVEEVDQSEVWHPAVKFYQMYNAQNQHIASFYTDWHPRDSKRGGAWMNAFWTGDRANGALVPHIGLMCGNMTTPLGDDPALLTHNEVQTVFHEFGHLLHHAVGNVEIQSLSGTNVAWDFVELPSQLMENWCWERQALDLFARHYQTQEPIPEELFQKLVASKNFRGASFFIRQLQLGSLDLLLHTQYQPDPQATAPDDIVQHLMHYVHKQMQRFSVPAIRPDNGFIAAFSHLFSSPVGYAAGYYSYKWAEVLDADAFSRFQAEGIFNAQTGADYIQQLLSLGNSLPPEVLFCNFMGRDPDPSALIKRSGFAN